jgi:hypothetical protein
MTPKAFGGPAIAAALTAVLCSSSVAHASNPPPSSPRYGSTILEYWNRANTVRCSNDVFDQRVKSSYEPGGATNRSNVVRRNNWSEPLLQPGLYVQLYQQIDPGTLTYKPRTTILYPSYVTDTKYPAPQNNETIAEDITAGRYQLWLPDDTKDDLVTTAMRQQSPTAFTANQTYVNQNTPENVRIMTLCMEGCFDGAVALEGNNGPASVEELTLTGAPSLLTLSSSSTIDRFAFQLTPVRSWLSDYAAFDQAFLELRTTAGRLLTVTPSHPLVLADGTVRRAEHLVAGDALLADDGSTDKLTGIAGVRRIARAYNVDVHTSELLPNFVSANGLLTGTQQIQTEDDSMLVRDVFRSTLSSTDLPNAT